MKYCPKCPDFPLLNEYYECWKCGGRYKVEWVTGSKETTSNAQEAKR